MVVDGTWAVVVAHVGSLVEVVRILEIRVGGRRKRWWWRTFVGVIRRAKNGGRGSWGTVFPCCEEIEEKVERMRN